MTSTIVYQPLVGYPHTWNKPARKIMRFRVQRPGRAQDRTTALELDVIAQSECHNRRGHINSRRWASMEYFHRPYIPPPPAPYVDYDPAAWYEAQEWRDHLTAVEVGAYR